MAKILVVDDEKAIRRSIREILEFEKHLVDEAEDGIKAMELLKKGGFDLVLCDVKMPKMDGIEFLMKMKEGGEGPAIIIISGHGTIDTAVEAVQKGAYDYLSKPIDRKKIVTLLNQYLPESEDPMKEDLQSEYEKPTVQSFTISKGKVIQEKIEIIGAEK